MTFTDYDAIPRFVRNESTGAARALDALRTAAWLTLVAAAIAYVGFRRARWLDM